ncbi:MAG: YhcN/YlaJ family sporulation lipoprotein [Bacillaceae bacterium]|nr:YhcN/YlaJ family sporulation lipoprotein [Bacillaceae bacterium]
MNKLALLGISTLTALTIAGCQGDDEGLGINNDYDTGIEPTRYNENNDIQPNRDRYGMNNNNLGPNYNNPDRNGMNNNAIGPDYNGTNPDRNWNADRGLNGDGDNLMDNTRFEVADDAADRIAQEVREVERAYVLAGNNNAYVAAVLDSDQERIDANLRERIERVVRSVDRDIDNVYVTANNEFVDLADGYVNGENRDGFYDDFNNMTQRLFPDMD